MVFVASITLVLVLVAAAAFIYGTIRLSMYAFRVSTGRGIAALLFPPYTFYFAFTELDEEGKEVPAASWLFGILVSALLIMLFYQPLQLLLAGEFDQLTATSPGKAAAAEYGTVDAGSEAPGEGAERPESESVPAEEPDAGSAE